MIRKIGAAVLFVEDVDKCAAFYRDRLGFRVTVTDGVSVAFRVTDDDHDFVVLKVSAAEEMVGKEAIALHTGASRVLLCADVDNVDETYTALMSKGVAFIRPPINQPWGLRTAYLADPEGHLWEIRQPLAAT